jgi:hypothetical protein
MRCRVCDYRLWNLTARRCPECGTPFLPSQFDFVPNSVQFCCPHCGQAYYGTGARGHLVPAAFGCVKCGAAVQMDEMVLLPTAGVEEEQTKIYKHPWLERKQRGRVKAWFATVGMALVSPGKLMRALPIESPASTAWWFAVVTTLLIGALPLLIIFGAIVLTHGSSMYGAVREASKVGIAVGVVMGIMMALVVLWGLVAHGVLRLTGRTAGGIGRTYQALCYSTGANAVSAIPCLGWYFGWIWWLISAVLMLKESQRVHGGRAALAGLLFPFLLLGGTVTGYVWMMVSVFSSVSATMAATTAQAGVADTRTVLNAILAYGAQNANRGPAHAVLLVTDGHLTGSDFIAAGSFTLESNAPVGNATLDQLGSMLPTQLRTTTQAAVAALPNGTVVHRLGDYLFTYHGIDLSVAHPNLWLVIGWPQSYPGPAGQTPPYTASPLVMPPTFTIGRADGTVSEYPAALLPAKLAEQNRLRAQYGLAPLPMPQSMPAGSPVTIQP